MSSIISEKRVFASIRERIVEWQVIPNLWPRNLTTNWNSHDSRGSSGCVRLLVVVELIFCSWSLFLADCISLFWVIGEKSVSFGINFTVWWYNYKFWIGGGLKRI